MKSFNRARLAVALAVLVCGAMGSTIASQRTGAAMASTATAFLASLTPEQREKAADPLDSTDRTHWNFIPTNMFPRQGLPIKEMTEPQRKLAHELLKSGLSQRGYTVTTTIMNDLEAILRDTEAAQRAAKPNPQGGAGNIRDPELYFFTVFGTPGPKGSWGWRVEGPPRLPALHRRQRQRRRRRPVVLGHQPGRSARRTEEGAAGARP